MPGAVLAKVDRMSMQASLEVRAPLLGRRVAAFAARLGAEDCFAPGSGKRVLKRLASRYIPPAWIDRPKQGFGLPISDWGVAPMLAAVEGALLAPDARLVEWFGRPLLDAFLARQRQAPRLYQLWSVFILESWLQHHPARPI
jgi:asparagine synthase (glutamine-hydrolysing)